MRRLRKRLTSCPSRALSIAGQYGCWRQESLLSIRKGNHGRISFYLQLLREATQLGCQAHRFRVALTNLEQGRREQALIEQMLLPLTVNDPGVLCELDSDRETGRGYKAVDPKRQAVWQLPDLYKFLCEW